MSSEIIEPSLGMSGSDDASGNLTGRAAPPAEDSQSDLPALASSPTPGATGTSSADELVLSPGRISPDPYLEEFRPERAPSPAPGDVAGRSEPCVSPTGPWARDDLDLDVPPSAEITAVSDSPFGVSAIAADLDLDTSGRKTAPAERSRPGPPPAVSPPPLTSDRFAALDLSAPPSSKAAPESARRKRATNVEKDASLDDVEEEEDLPAPHSSWPMALLASYASAVTLGLIWVVWGHRIARESTPVEPDAFPTTELSADPGHRAGQSRRFVPPDPLPAERIVALGETIVIDSLEVTPLEIRTGPVILRREINKLQARPGGNDALILKLRLKNLSSDSILVPLDEAFIRTRSREIRDSVIEAGPSQQIDMFPLAIVSEWAIVGQEFPELRPGESHETAVVSAPDALGHVAPEMTWRLRLRTDVNQTGTLGIRFHKEDIRALSPRETPDLPERPEPGDSPPGTSANPAQ